jgi:hypothetical protein
MHEPAVALSDFLLGAETLVLAGLLLRRRSASEARAGFVGLFLSSSLAALIGGIVHGFLNDGSAVYRIAWELALLAIGAAASAAWIAAGHVLGSPAAIRATRLAASVTGAVYAICVLAVTRDFTLAAIASSVAAVFLLTAFVAASLQRRDRRLLAGVTAILVIFAASALQQLRVTIGGWDHNTVYHALLMLALPLLWFGANAVIRRGSRQ